MKALNLQEYKTENVSSTKNRGSSILLLLVVRAEIDVVSKRKQNCIVVMCGYDFKTNAFFPILPCWFWNVSFTGTFSNMKMSDIENKVHSLAGGTSDCLI